MNMKKAEEVIDLKWMVQTIKKYSLAKKEIDKLENLQSIEELQETYYGWISKLVNQIKSEVYSNPFLDLDLEEVLLCGIDVQENSANDNPVIFFNTRYREHAKALISQENSDELNKLIETTIIDSKYNNRESVLVYKGDVPFKTQRVGTQIRCIEWENYGELTRLQPIRLIEKIEKCFKEKHDKNANVRIACIGQLYGNTSQLESYFKYKNQQIKVVQFKPEKEPNAFTNDGQTIRLDDFENLKELVKEYDLIILTDNTKFYRRFQSQKNEIEKNDVEYLNLYWNKAQNTEDIWDKNLYYYLLYQTAVNYYAGRNNTMSAKYEFDEQIIKRFEYVLNSSDFSAEVYCYISENNVIANQDISDSNVCRDEYYDGKEVIVYKIEKQQKVQETTAEEDIFERIAGDTYIDMWKFVKSIGNTFYDSYSDKYNTQIDIDQWRNCELVLQFSKVERVQDKIRIIYGFKCNDEETVDHARRLFDSMAELIYHSKYTCVRNYLRNLFSSAMMSRAASVKGVVFSYLFNNGLPVEFVYKNIRNNVETSQNQCLHFKDRKAIYVILEHLSHMIIRNVELKEMILLTELKTKYMQNTSQQQFEKYLQEIHEACEIFGDTKSRIYYYTDIGKGESDNVK